MSAELVSDITCRNDEDKIDCANTSRNVIDLEYYIPAGLV
jgi:hypothetical protein